MRRVGAGGALVSGGAYAGVANCSENASLSRRKKPRFVFLPYGGAGGPFVEAGAAAGALVVESARATEARLTIPSAARARVQRLNFVLWVFWLGFVFICGRFSLA